MVLNYTSLDPKRSEIRLLTILPSTEFHAQISCLLHVASLDNITEFEALSYVWGDDSVRESIDVDGSPLLVTANLVAALRRLRRVQEPRVIWADAVCINQADDAEKSIQVPLMGRLYSSANPVVWLGEPSEEMELALSWARTYIENTDPTAPSSMFWAKLKSEYHHSPEAREETYKAIGRAFEGLSQFQTLPYWSRMWTLQEYKLPEAAPICLCGLFSFYAELLDEARKPLKGEMRMMAQDDRTSTIARLQEIQQRLEESLGISFPVSPSQETLPTTTQRQFLQRKERTSWEELESSPSEWPEDLKLHHRDLVAETAAILTELQEASEDALAMTQFISGIRTRLFKMFGIFGVSGIKPHLPEIDLLQDKLKNDIALLREKVIESLEPGKMVSFASLRQSPKWAPWPFLSLLLDSSNRNCRYVRDKVYALYSMAPRIQELYPPDYTKPKRRVFHETAVYIIRHEELGMTEMFDNFTLPGLDHTDKSHTCPSWVPDFEQGRHYIDRMGKVSGVLVKWGEAMPVMVSQDLTTLNIWARSLGKARTILVFEQTMPAIVGQIIDMLNRAVDDLVPSDMHLRTSQHVFGAIARACAGRSGGEDYTHDGIVSAYNRLHDHFARGLDGTPDTYDDSYQMNQLASRTADLAGQKLVLTDLGCFGVCPGSAVDGDLVALPPHFGRPVVLRKCGGPVNQSGAQHYKLAGIAHFAELVDEDCYNQEVVEEVAKQEPMELFLF